MELPCKKLTPYLLRLVKHNDKIQFIPILLKRLDLQNQISQVIWVTLRCYYPLALNTLYNIYFT